MTQSALAFVRLIYILSQIVFTHVAQAASEQIAPETWSSSMSKSWLSGLNVANDRPPVTMPVITIGELL